MKKILLLLGLVVLVGGAVYFGIRFGWQKKPVAPNKPVRTQTKQDVTQLRVNKIIAESAKTDADLDGLTNEEEKARGTDPDLADTDGDGLDDSSEIKYFLTDPKKKDTLQIGQTDGWAAAHGVVDAQGKRHLDLLSKISK